MVEVVVTGVFESWYEDLNESDTDAVNLGVERLEQFGVSLGHPYSSAIKGWRYPIRELRVQSGGRPLRIFYAFDPRRQAVLLLGADKGSEGNAIYQRLQETVEGLWETYLEETGQGD